MIGEGLSPGARALLDAARDGMAPDAAAVRRMRGKVAGAVGGTAATGAIAAKLGILAVVATLGVGAALLGNRDNAVTPQQIELPAAQSEVIAPPVRLRVEAVASHAPIEMAPQQKTGPDARPDSRSDARPDVRIDTRLPVPAAPAPAALATSKPAAKVVRADLAREVELVDRAMSALRRGDTSGALAAIRTHATETRGTGQLAEDVAAIEIEALCRRHDPSVATKLDAFDARYPRSAQRSRLSITCP